MIFDFFNYIVAGWSAQLGISPPPEWMGSWRHHCPVANNITKKAKKGKVQNHALHIFHPIFWLTNFYFFNFIVAGRSTQLEITLPPVWLGSRWHHCPVANNTTKKAVKGHGKNHALHVFYPIFQLTIFYFFNFIIAGWSAQLGISQPPEWMGSQHHHCPVANNITKKAEKGHGKKPCHPYFLPHFLTNKFLFFQLHCFRAVHTIGDISTPRMNGKPATPSPCCQQHYQEGWKRARYETMPSTFSTPFSHS